VLFGATAFTTVLLFDARSSRMRGWLLIAAYVLAAIAFFIAGDR
jgi:hypothetical protein